MLNGHWHPALFMSMYVYLPLVMQIETRVYKQHVVLNSAVYMHIHIAMPHMIPIKAMVMFTGQKYEVNPRVRPA